jgi:hypothetical protein
VKGALAVTGQDKWPALVDLRQEMAERGLDIRVSELKRIIATVFQGQESVNLRLSVTRGVDAGRVSQTGGTP